MYSWWVHTPTYVRTCIVHCTYVQYNHTVKFAKASPNRDWNIPSEVDWQISFKLIRPLPFSFHDCVSFSNVNSLAWNCKEKTVDRKCTLITISLSLCVCTWRTTFSFSSPVWWWNSGRLLREDWSLLPNTVSMVGEVFVTLSFTEIGVSPESTYEWTCVYIPHSRKIMQCFVFAICSTYKHKYIFRPISTLIKLWMHHQFLIGRQIGNHVVCVCAYIYTYMY